MNSVKQPLRDMQKKPRPVGKLATASEKSLHSLKQNPNRANLVKAVYAGHVRGGHAFH